MMESLKMMMIPPKERLTKKQRIENEIMFLMDMLGRFTPKGKTIGEGFDTEYIITDMSTRELIEQGIYNKTLEYLSNGTKKNKKVNG